MFNQAAENAAEAARLLREELDDLSGLETGHQKVRACERRGDEITDEILSRLNASFVTPFDREDIHALTEELDDIVDDIYAASDLLVLHQVEKPLPEMRELADTLVRATQATVDLLVPLVGLRGLESWLKAIDRIESQADQVYRSSVAKLFSGEFRALEVLKWKDVLEAIENSVNRTEKIADIVHAIQVKHA